MSDRKPILDPSQRIPNPDSTEVKVQRITEGLMYLLPKIVKDEVKKND
jgi:hypothetical protein